MAVITDSVYCPECCATGEACSDYQVESEYHGEDECPNACAGEGDPCFTFYNQCPASCANASITFDVISKEFPESCITGKAPKASVLCYFDDLGSVSGDNSVLSCDLTGSCYSCYVFGVITPNVIPVGNGKIKLSVTVNGLNAYWGGPYSAAASVEFYFE